MNVPFKPDGGGPRRRFNPGEYITLKPERHNVKLWEIIYCYRLTDQRSEWVYCIEERLELKKVSPGDVIGQIANSLGLGQNTPRVFNTGTFRNGGDAMQYFWDIPAFGSVRTSLKNTDMMKQAKVISSGEIL